MLREPVPFDWAGVRVAVPRPSTGLPGVRMAGFGQRAVAPVHVDIAMVAHPSVTLLFDLSDGADLVCGSEGRRGRGSVVVGLLPGELRAGGRVGACLQIRLEPVAAAAVFGPAAELRGAVESLADVWGRDSTERAEAGLRTAVTWDERFAVAVDILGRRMEEGVRGRGCGRPPVDAEVAHTWRRTLAGRGRVRVEGLAYETGWSRKRLSARFRSQLGITPKRAARLVRFDHAAHLLAAGLAPADVAHGSGYADQSHLHREVKAFTGLTPTAVAAAPWLAIDDVAWPDATSPR
ncbi:helix-turn-helix domain-containing protein [Streptomyces sp. NBC_00237]|uniref:AraC family transcriptional regulator n=1 Tax=Streptomyces sp. NBC_00237 TaxID=2975687 RepID=UPI00225BEE94|nr:helix-turn-helix domain-containing protein [Streptomyces sp. NBC_00237]MCX5207137.1 helix-turn-helix domain-containing protein [Streptomyces sp. NBC_00237]